MNNVGPQTVEPLVQRTGPAAGLLLKNAELLDPFSDLTGRHDLLVRDGEIVEISEAGVINLDDDPAGSEGIEIVDAEGYHVFPAFFDPHVHLRTPGQEYKEDIETGTRAAAAGGYGGIIAMANTSPPVSNPADIEALRHRAGLVASVPVGFTATVTKDMKGEELTDMSELREAGAVGFTASAVASIDNDATIDGWSVNDVKGGLTQAVPDDVIS